MSSIRELQAPPALQPILGGAESKNASKAQVIRSTAFRIMSGSEHEYRRFG